VGNVAVVVRRHNISPHTIHTWRSKAEKSVQQGLGRPMRLKNQRTRGPPWESKYQDDRLKRIAAEKELQERPENWCSSRRWYSEGVRKQQFAQTLEDKFGKRDLKWFITRLNYHSIGAYLSAILRQKRYQREMKKFFAATTFDGKYWG